MLLSACAPRTVTPASFDQWRTTDAIRAFQSANLRFEIPQVSKDERDLFAETALESRPFVIPLQGDPSLARGIIFSFEDESNLFQVQMYYTHLGNALPQFGSWVFVKDNLLLQINREVPEAVAQKYAQALDLLGEQ